MNFLSLLLLFFVINISTGTILDENYIQIPDYTGQKILNIKMKPLHFDVLKSINNVTFWVKMNKAIKWFSCHSHQKVRQGACYNNLECEWITEVPVTDATVISLFSGRGIDCEIISENNGYPFTFYSGNILPNINTKLILKIETIFNEKYNIWIQGLISFLSIFFAFIILMIMYFCIEK